MSTKTKKPRLGRGLSSLMSGSSVAVPLESPSAEAAYTAPPPSDGQSSLVWIALDSATANPYQPRQTFDEEGLAQLAASIRQDGVMQPIVVRPAKADPSRYEIVAGERRWRAAGIAGLDQIPAILRDIDDLQLAEWAIIENLQREDLDPIEQAGAFARLAEQFNLTHEQIADRIGIDRSTVTNSLRLLQLPEEAREFVRRGQLTAGHVRSLLGIDGPLLVDVARRAVRESWSVRRLEDQVRRMLAEGQAAPARKTRVSRSAHLTDLARQIAEQLNTKVEIRPGREKNSGRLIIDYYGLEAFDSLMQRLGVTLD